MSTLIALLRGINVGAHKRIPMADLRELLAERGYEDVRTHLQSGNVVLSTTRKPDEAARDMEAGIEERTGFDVDVIVRTAAQLEKVVAADPFADVANDGAKHFVAFLAAKPPAAAVRTLEAEDFAPDEFAVKGKEIYTWCPEGMRDSNLMRLLAGRKVVPSATVRNWNTVTKLLDIACGP